MSYGYSVRLIEANRQADPKRLGVRLGRLCIKRNMSVAEVSGKLGVSRQTVYNWFCGSSDPQNTVTAAVEKLVASLTSK
jgi:transcriptional regulator with XRE-family HTH domain